MRILNLESLRFNPRPCEGATGLFFEDLFPCCVSIRAPVKGRLRPELPRLRSQRFNPRPCEGATGLLESVDVGSKVSIRAPVKGRHPGRM